MTSAFASLLAKPDYAFVNLLGLKTFFKRNGFYATQDDMIAIIKRLDLNYDEAISMEELSRCLMFYDQGLKPSARLDSQRSSAMKENYFSLGRDPSQS